MQHIDPILTSLTAAVSTGAMHAVSLIAEGTPPGGTANDLSGYFSAFEKLGVVGGACVCCFFLYKAVSKKDDQLQATHAKHLADLVEAHEERVGDLKAQIEHLKSREP